MPRFHITWGTGTGIVEPFVNSARRPRPRGLLTFHHRHRVDELVITDGAVTGVRGTVLAADDSARGVTSNREAVGDFDLTAQAVVVTTGGIGANHELVRRYWPQRMGTPPKPMVTGVPAYVDGRMLDIARGLRCAPGQPRPHVALHRGHQQLEPDLARPRHPDPARPVLDVVRRPRPAPARPLPARLRHPRHAALPAHHARHRPYDHSWFILTQKIIEKEFALSGSEQNPDITPKARRRSCSERVFGKGAPAPVEAFKTARRGLRRRGQPGRTRRKDERADRRSACSTPTPCAARSRPATCNWPTRSARTPRSKASATRGSYLADRLGRTAAPHRILDPAAGPLIGVKLHILTRKTLGGIQTDLSSRALGLDGEAIGGLYAAGEVAGFGGGGVHGYNALEGTFLGGCLFSGRAAGRAAAAALGHHGASSPSP